MRPRELSRKGGTGDGGVIVRGDEEAEVKD